MRGDETVSNTQAVVAPVVIAGGGPVGIGTALELATHGVPSIVLEKRNRGECFAARTNLTNLRSMEHFRRWGIADLLRRNDPVGDDFVRSITYVTALNGHVVADLTRIFEFGDRLPFSSDRAEWAPNAGIEETVQQAAERDPLIDIRFGSEVTDLHQDESGVTVTYRHGDETASVRGQYLVAADGSRSEIRHRLGIRLDGVPDLVQASIWYIHAPGLKERMDTGRSSFVFFINEHRDNMMLIAQDSDDHFMFGMLPVADDADADSWELARTALFRNIGFEIDVTPISGGRVRVHSLLTPEFRSGRVFLAGDAAHLISPMGGFGMNLGIGDAADLGWKLAAAVQGWGGDELLDSYGAERTSVISWIQQACVGNTERNAASFTTDGLSDDTPQGAAMRAELGELISTTKVEEFKSFGAQLGSHYHGSPVIASDGTVPPPVSQGDYVPCATPGCRAPHVWLDDETSLYDRFGSGFTLLVTAGAAPDTTAIEIAARDRNMPLTVLAPERPDLLDLYGTTFVLIRPDQHIAWRGDRLPDDSGAILDIVRGAAARTGATI